MQCYRLADRASPASRNGTRSCGGDQACRQWAGELGLRGSRLKLPPVFRQRLAHFIRDQNVVRDSVPDHVEPAPTTVLVTPTLAVRAFGICAIEEVIGPFAIADLQRGSHQ